MRNFGNDIKNYYGTLSITAPTGLTALTVSGGIASDLINNSGLIGCAGLLQVTGSGTTGIALSAGTEIFNSGSAGVIQAYNRSTSVYLPMTVSGSTVSLNVSGTTALTMAANQGAVFGAATGGSQGAGTVNATGLYVNGVAVSSSSGSVDSVLSSNFTVNNTTTLAASGLSVTLSSTGYYQFETTLLTNAVSSSSGAKFQLTGGTATISTVQSLLESGSVNGTSVPPQLTNMVSSATALTSVGTTGSDVLIIKGTINCTATGTVILEFAQNTAIASNTSLVAGSFIKFSKL
jgi:hypothetical protein